MKNVSQKLTMQELLALTTIKLCADCGYQHAPVRTCEEAELELKYCPKPNSQK